MLGHKTTRTTGENIHHSTSWRNVQLQEWVKLGLELKMWECPTMEHSDHSAHHPKKQSEQWYSNKSARFCWENTNFIYKLISFDQESLVNSQRIWYFKTILLWDPGVSLWSVIFFASDQNPLWFQPLTHPLTPKAHIFGVCEAVSAGRVGIAWFTPSSLCQLLLAPPTRIKNLPLSPLLLIPS